jgi:replicative DNA helicase
MNSVPDPTSVKLAHPVIPLPVHQPASPPHERVTIEEPRPQLCRLGDLLGSWEAEAWAAHEARVNGAPRGPLTGLSKLDRELGGAFSPGLHIVHGQPGAGKTAFALQVVAGCRCPALYVTCEMSPLELLRRMTARLTQTYLGRLKSGELCVEDSLTLARSATAQVPDVALADATQAYASPIWIRDAALATRGQAQHLLIVVDSVHSWAESASSMATEYDALNAALAALRALSHQLCCPVLAVAERNRDSISRGGLSAGAGTRKIEYGAETVIDLTRDLSKREDMTGEVEVKVKLAKNRHGAAGKEVDLCFHGALQRFREL